MPKGRSEAKPFDLLVTNLDSSENTAWNALSNGISETPYFHSKASSPAKEAVAKDEEKYIGDHSIISYNETLNKLKELNKTPLKLKQNNFKSVEEQLSEVYKEVNWIEASLSKAINIASLMIKKN